MRLRHSAGLVLSAAFVFALPGTVLAADSEPRTYVIGVDHVDLANQRPDLNRVFEYTDFFSRQVRIRQGDTIDFQAAPGSFHIVALAKSEKVARTVYPVALLDADGGSDTAIGTGLPKLVLGPSNFSITGGSTHGGGTIGTNPGGPACGVAAFGQAPCVFRGADDIEVIGPTPGFGASGPIQVDQLVNITAAPGQYAFFCFIHPGMRGTLTVVSGDASTSTQDQINEQGRAQFQQDREAALKVEAQLNRPNVRGDKPGERTFVVNVGASAANNHVAIDEMLPHRTLDLVTGDSVLYLWRDPHNVHTVSFPTASSPTDSILPAPFGFDCGSSFSSSNIGPPPLCFEPGDSHSRPPEFIGDPGTAPAGTKLTNPAALLDSGLLIGTGYGVKPSAQSWSVRTGEATAAGTYMFQCVVHDFMHGWLNVKPGDQSGDQSGDQNQN